MSWALMVTLGVWTLSQLFAGDLIGRLNLI
jgi:hypothetical protein